MFDAEESENFALHVVTISNGERREENIVSEIKSLKEALDEKNREISKLTEEVETILEERKELNFLLKAKDKQIESLKKQVIHLKVVNEDLKERLISLEAESTELTKKNEDLEKKIDELIDDLKSKNAEIILLKGEIDELKTQVKKLTIDNEKVTNQMKKVNTDNEKVRNQMKKVNTDNEKVRNQLKKVNTDNTQLKETCALLEGKNMELEDKVTLLDDKIQFYKEEQKKIKQKLEDQIRSRRQERAIEMPKSNDALVLGELCWRVQSMIYKNVLPQSEYDERVSYKIDYLEQDLDLLEEKVQAKKAWKEVLETLNWDERKVKRLARAMRMIQGQRNVVAHPELNEEMINQSVQRMNAEGKLSCWCSFADVTELICAWKKLNEN